MRQTTPWALLTAFVAMIALPLQGQAQTSDGSVPRQVWERAARNNWYIRIVPVGEDTIVGRVRFWRGEARIADAAVPDRVVQLDRRTTHGGGSTLGAVVGFIAGAVVFGGLAAGDESSSPTGWIFVLAGGGGGAVLGMLAGHAAAPGRDSWEIVWPRELHR